MTPTDPTPSRAVDITVRRSFPYPIASAWHRVALATSDAERIDQLTALQEVLVRTLAAVFLPDYLRGDREPRVETAIGRLERPSLGIWVELVRETIRALRQRTEPPPFIPEAGDWYFDARGKPGEAARRLDQLVQLRNRAAHEAPAIGAGEVAGLARELHAGAHGLLDSLTWLSGYRLVRVLSQEPVRSGGTRGKVQVFQGVEALPEPVPMTWEAHLLPGSVYLVDPTGGGLLEVTPWMQVLPDAGTRQDRLFLGKGHRKGKELVLVHDDTGAEVRTGIATEAGQVPLDAWLDTRDALALWQENRDPAGGFRAVDEGLPIGPGEVLDERFEVLDLLGEGGMAQVVRVRDRGFDAVVALKILKGEFSEDRDFRERFRREARTMAGLTHPGIVPVQDSGRLPDGRLFLKMPVVDGGTLRDRIQPGGLAQAEVVEIARQVLETLAYLHEQGVVHRDIKPSNFLLDADGGVRLSDFGIALREEDVRLTRTLERLGSLAYTSPEQRLGRQVDARSDVYSLALVLHALATGQEATGLPGTGVEGRLGEVLRRMGEPEAGQRPSAAEALRWIGDLDAGSDPARATDEPTAEGTARPKKSWMSWIVSLALTAVIVGVVVLLVFGPERGPEAPPAPEIPTLTFDGGLIRVVLPDTGTTEGGGVHPSPDAPVSPDRVLQWRITMTHQPPYGELWYRPGGPTISPPAATSPLASGERADVDDVSLRAALRTFQRTHPDHNRVAVVLSEEDDASVFGKVAYLVGAAGFELIEVRTSEGAAFEIALPRWPQEDQDLFTVSSDGVLIARSRVGARFFTPPLNQTVACTDRGYWIAGNAGVLASEEGGLDDPSVVLGEGATEALSVMLGRIAEAYPENDVLYLVAEPGVPFRRWIDVRLAQQQVCANCRVIPTAGITGHGTVVTASSLDPEPIQVPLDGTQFRSFPAPADLRFEEDWQPEQLARDLDFVFDARISGVGPVHGPASAVAWTLSTEAMIGLLGARTGAWSGEEAELSGGSGYAAKARAAAPERTPTPALWARIEAIEALEQMARGDESQAQLAAARHVTFWNQPWAAEDMPPLLGLEGRFDEVVDAPMLEVFEAAGRWWGEWNSLQEESLQKDPAFLHRLAPVLGHELHRGFDCAAARNKLAGLDSAGTVTLELRFDAEGGVTAEVVGSTSGSIAIDDCVVDSWNAVRMLPGSQGGSLRLAVPLSP